MEEVGRATQVEGGALMGGKLFVQGGPTLEVAMRVEASIEGSEQRVGEHGYNEISMLNRSDCLASSHIPMLRFNLILCKNGSQDTRPFPNWRP